ncbi:ENOYL-COA DELTA ISOMERASE 1 PEROXISOMAL [Salix viminalis]|uniref:ENOYL-COA DELTA ISOMERASE 1 PEROXISOMAL n=1 Tax=Salix viminalis TaxID=40686 RepID=A0A9Q0Z3T5_SALVM|nr:ENOYL-COA DELTA ISOMERASE 1 PEROXISOMAL [Salix viminalis]
MCTLEKRGDIYILTLTGSDEHRLNPTLVDSIRSALRRVRAEPASPSSALVTIAEGKFFSNGFDLAWAHSSQPRLELMSAKLQLLDRGFLYMSELDIGLVLPDWFMVLLKCKIGDAKVRSEIILTAAKLTAEMAANRMVVLNEVLEKLGTVTGEAKTVSKLYHDDCRSKIAWKTRQPKITMIVKTNTHSGTSQIIQRAPNGRFVGLIVFHIECSCPSIPLLHHKRSKGVIRSATTT